MALDGKEKEAIRSLVAQEVRDVLAAALAREKAWARETARTNGTGYPPARPPSALGAAGTSPPMGIGSSGGDGGAMGGAVGTKSSARGTGRRPLARPKKMTPAQAGEEGSKNGADGPDTDLQQLLAALQGVREQLVRQLDETIQRLEELVKAQDGTMEKKPS